MNANQTSSRLPVCLFCVCLSRDNRKSMIPPSARREFNCLFSFWLLFVCLFPYSFVFCAIPLFVFIFFWWRWLSLSNSRNVNRVSFLFWGATGVYFPRRCGTQCCRYSSLNFSGVSLVYLFAPYRSSIVALSYFFKSSWLFVFTSGEFESSSLSTRLQHFLKRGFSLTVQEDPST